jgi:hypothetical protein
VVASISRSKRAQSRSGELSVEQPASPINQVRRTFILGMHGDAQRSRADGGPECSLGARLLIGFVSNGVCFGRCGCAGVYNLRGPVDERFAALEGTELICSETHRDLRCVAAADDWSRS